jgi:hypothetical protein
MRHSLKIQDREDLGAVYRRTTIRKETSRNKIADTDEEPGEIHAVRSFLADLPTYLILSKAFRVYTGQVESVKAFGVRDFSYSTICLALVQRDY